jgi:hypothetical protein
MRTSASIEEAFARSNLAPLGRENLFAAIARLKAAGRVGPDLASVQNLRFTPGLMSRSLRRSPGAGRFHFCWKILLGLK